nr:PREDICTED: targeting protein for Xklp2-like [Megachile rotundata]
MMHEGKGNFNLLPNGNRNKCRHSSIWDHIESPQFVDFSNLPETGDSFFNKVTVVVSTPNPRLNNEKLPNTVVEENALIASFDNFSLSGIQHGSYNDGNSTVKENYVVHNSSVKLVEIKNEKCTKTKKPLNTMVNPFTFAMRDKYMEQRKQERINKMLEEEKKVKIFRANPVPKFLKARLVHNNNNNDKNEQKANGNINGKVTKTVPAKEVKKNTEAQKKLTLHFLRPKVRPKTPPLRTTTRAQQRKRFDEAIKEKEKQREELKQMEIAAKKKQEKEELLLLRKQLVHKAQPIRNYKLNLPPIEKRPLTDPVSPLTLKRRRQQ